MESRQEKRLPIESFTMPFLGSRENDHFAFQYLLQDTSTHGARIAVPNWVVQREALAQGELINLHLPLALEGGTFDQGSIAWHRWSGDEQAQLCGINLTEPAPPIYQVMITPGRDGLGLDLRGFEADDDLALQVLHDVELLKSGVLVYLKHMVPLFSRLAAVSAAEYEALKTVLWDDVRQRVTNNREGIRKLRDELAPHLRQEGSLAGRLDLEALRAMMESELYADLFRTAMDSPLINPYLDAIKHLEKKLYASYNALVMLYLRSV